MCHILVGMGCMWPIIHIILTLQKLLFGCDMGVLCGRGVLYNRHAGVGVFASAVTQCTHVQPC